MVNRGRGVGTVLVVVAIGVVLVGAGRRPSNGNGGNGRELEAVDLSPGDRTISVGQTIQFTATGVWSDGTESDVTAEADWFTTNSAVLSVNSLGRAEGLAAGSAGIFCRFDGVQSDGTLILVDPQADVVDSFGIAKLYPSNLQGSVWESTHWHNGVFRVLAGDPAPEEDHFDPFDPSGWTRTRSGHDFFVDGAGVGGSSRDALVGGSSASLRFEINPSRDGSSLFRNVEVTAYYMRIEDDNPFHGGLAIGVRDSTTAGHSGSTNCVHTLYGRLGNDGAAVFVKELNHSQASERGRTQVFSGGLPFGEWIGMKFVVRDLPGGDVRLELYMDLTNGEDGGIWQLVTAFTDTGGWDTSNPCLEQHDFRVLENGQAFIRNDWGSNSQPLPEDFLDCRYKWLSVREIGG